MKFSRLFLMAALLAPVAAHAEDYTLTLKNHAFTPTEITVPAGQKFKLTVKNEDAAPAEFESEKLNREKIVPANSSVVVNLGPLDAGSYAFVDDFHKDVAKGTITAK
jgi:hypothetical protein